MSDLASPSRGLCRIFGLLLLIGWLSPGRLHAQSAAGAKPLSSAPVTVDVPLHRLPSVVKKWAHGAPDLVIELLSPSTAGRDHVTKRQAYAKHKIPEYRIVDPEACTVTVLALEGEHYDKLANVAGDVPIPSKVLAGLPVLACDLFRD
ncbi:MAG: Uma2 family endonuclease [Candidatus Wallbacteria bacterium]|nr:Uma2 family endonuclease [Candidatus Wallbacteria bacterium]